MDTFHDHLIIFGGSARRAYASNLRRLHPYRRVFLSQRMEKDTVTQEAFDTLLCWLDRNRDSAGQKYEKIRTRLIRVFVGRGCLEPEALADETINRVTKTLPRVLNTYIGDPALYFYGVANNVHHEWIRRQARTNDLQIEAIADDGDRTVELDCLDECLGALPQGHKILILEYYKVDKAAKIEHRRQLAKERGIGLNALQIKTSRIRAGLRRCVQNCAETKGN